MNYRKDLAMNPDSTNRIYKRKSPQTLKIERKKNKIKNQKSKNTLLT